MSAVGKIIKTLRKMIRRTSDVYKKDSKKASRLRKIKNPSRRQVHEKRLAEMDEDTSASIADRREFLHAVKLMKSKGKKKWEVKEKRHFPGRRLGDRE